MYFLMQCIHHPNMDAQRDINRTEHREWVKSSGQGCAAVLIGSATTDDTGTSTGNFGILEATSFENAMAFAEGDPFNREAIVAEIKMTALPDGFQAHRITEPMSSL